MGGARVWSSGRPGVFFGAVDTPDRGQRLTYLAFFEHPVTSAEAWSHTVGGKTSNDGFVATSEHRLSFGGDEFRAVARVEWDGAGRRSTGSVMIDDRDVDPDEGVVFLVDFRDEMRVRQIDVELRDPGLPPFGDAGYEDAVAAYAADVVRALGERDDVREFFARER